MTGGKWPNEDEMKWNGMEWIGMKWNEMKWNEKQISSFLSSRWGDLCSEEYFSSFSESTVSNAVVIVGWNTGRKPSTSQVKIKIASRMLWRLACVLASASPTAHRTTRPAHLNLCVGVASQSTITLKWLHLLDVPILWSENVLRDVTAMVVFNRSWRFNMYKRIKLVFFGRHIGTELLVRWLLYGEVFSLLSYGFTNVLLFFFSMCNLSCSWIVQRTVAEDCFDKAKMVNVLCHLHAVTVSVCSFQFHWLLLWCI